VTIASNGTKVQYTPLAGYSGTETFTYTIQDPSGASDTATVTVTVSITSRASCRATRTST